ncbi:MAG: hypothetical protein LC687_06325, partial [Actinobacteria bacterium]|nr:hypothetical protein [Actinomycetota bacterium]
MTTPSTSVTYNHKGVGDLSRTRGVFVHLEQEELPGNTERVSISTMERLYERALQGMSAASYRAPYCPIVNDGDDFTIWLDFYAFPSSEDLEYTIKSDIGELSSKIVTSVRKQTEVIFGLTDYYDIEHLPLEAAARWETPCYTYDS